MTLIRSLFACLLVALTFAAIETGAFLNSERKNSDDLRARIDAIQIDLHKVLTQTAALESHVDDSLTKLDEVQDQQAHYWTHLETKTGVAIGQISGVAMRMQDLVSNTDASLNRRPDGIMPTLQGLAISADNGVQMFTSSTQPVIDETKNAMHYVEQSMKAVNDLAQDESWQHVPENVDAMTTALMEASGNINATSVDVRNVVHSCAAKHGLRRLLCEVL